MPIIQVHHVTKEFKLGQLHSMGQTLRDAGARLLGRRVSEPALFQALDDVSFTIERGEVLGLIGHNGAGKSTLLKTLAGVSSPTRGSVAVRGRVAPLIEVGAGLVPDLTGRENLFLNATILGMKRREILRKFDQIVDFAELRDFVDTPVKRYSSGMQVRLGFAIATSVEAEILIVDEVLAVGDLSFQRKCFDRIEQLIKREGRTVLVVSHNIRQVARMCTRVILLDHGKIAGDGTATEICNAFYESSDRKINLVRGNLHPLAAGRVKSSGDIELVAIAVLDGAGHEIRAIRYRDDITVKMTFEVRAPLKKPVFGIGVHTTDFVYLATNHHAPNESPEVLNEGTHEVRCSISRFPFLPGTYSLRVGVAVGNTGATAFYVENACMLTVVSSELTRADPDVTEGFVNLDTMWGLPSVGKANAIEQIPQVGAGSHVRK